MGLIIQKFGGSSVSSFERIRRVVDIVKRTREAGHSVLVVVSAAQGVTDALLKKAHTFTPFPDLRVVDRMLSTGEAEMASTVSLAFQAVGIASLPFSGMEAGVLTDGRYTRAGIIDMQCETLKHQLERGAVPVVAGFQGGTKEGDTTTLGRGGSDLTALALAAALGAEVCEIYTDVAGVFTADPRIVPAAHCFKQISFSTLAELSSLGGRVMQTRAVEFARRCRIPFRVLSSFEEVPGTCVDNVRSPVHALAVDIHRISLEVSGLHPATLAHLLSNKGIAADGFQSQGKVTLFTVPQEDIWKTHALCEKEKAPLVLQGPIARLSWVGEGIGQRGGRALVDAVIGPFQLQGVTQGRKRISAFLPIEAAEEAARTLHEAAGLEEDGYKGSRLRINP